MYYKLGQLLQIRAIIKNCGISYKTKNVRELSCLTFLIRWAGQRVVDYLKKSKNSYHFFYFNILVPSPSTRLIIFPKLFPNLSLVRFQVFGILIPLAYLPSQYQNCSQSYFILQVISFSRLQSLYRQSKSYMYNYTSTVIYSMWHLKNTITEKILYYRSKYPLASHEFTSSLMICSFTEPIHLFEI